MKKNLMEDDFYALENYKDYEKKIKKNVVQYDLRINENVEKILESNVEKIFEIKNTYIVGATSGVGEGICKYIKEKNGEFYPIGSRNIEKITKIGEEANKDGFFVSGDLFEEDSDSYKYSMEELPEKEGAVQLLSSVDMDSISMIDKKGNKQVDIIDPRTGKYWESSIKNEEKDEVRKEMADKQIEFWSNFFENLLNRKSRKPLTIIYANSIISKYYENSIISSHSQYGRLKNIISNFSDKYREELESKNVFIKNILLGITETPMFNNRGELSAVNTAKLGEILGPMLPISGEAISARKALNADDVSEFFFEIGNEDPKHTPNRIILFKDEHLDVGNIIIKNKEKQDELKSKIELNKNNFKINEDGIEIDEYAKDFLRKLRRDSLDKYLEENPKIANRKLEINMKFAEKILDKLPKNVSYSSFIDIAQRLEDNYP